MLLKTGGPTASVRSIRFSPDNQYLYAAGIDKQVHVWKLYDANNKLTPRKTQSYYWTLNRAERGCIYTMDVSRTGSIAFGGYSAYGNSGDILEFDGANRRLTGVLPRKRSNDLTVPRTGHRTSVIEIAYSPNGESLVSMSRNGETRVWTGQGQARTSKMLRPPGERTDRQSVAYLDNTHVAIAERDPASLKGSFWKIVIYDVRTGMPVAETKSCHAYGVFSIARDPFLPGRWASADVVGRIYVWSGVNAPKPIAGAQPTVRINPATKIDLFSKAYSQYNAAHARELRFAPKNKLLVSTGFQVDGQKSRPAKLLLMDLSTNVPSILDSDQVLSLIHI